MKLNLDSVSYRERLLWVSLAFTLAFLVYILAALLSGSIYEERAGLRFAHFVVLMIVLNLIVTSILSSTSRNRITDERDSVFESIGFRYGYFFLFGASCFLVGHEFMNHLFDYSGSEIREFGLGLRLNFHSIIVVLLLSEIVKTGSQILFYRRGY